MEWAVCGGATIAALLLHILYWCYAGGLWRDEATSVYIGTAGSLGQMGHLLRYESFPGLFHTIIRVWSMIGLGSSDAALRGLGFLAGLSVLAVLWLSARVLTGTLPFISLALLATNLTLIRWGDSLRAYGIGCSLIVLTLLLVWQLIKKPGAARFAAASLAAVLSVQCLYQNAFLLLAICLGACFVCFRRQQEKVAFMVVGVGAIAAISLLPYLGTITASQQSFAVARVGFNASIVFDTWANALGNPGYWPIAFWVILALAAMVRGFTFVPIIKRRDPVGDEDLPLFATVTSSFCIILFVLFVVVARLPTQPWYWLPPMVMVAVCTDAGLRDWLAPHRAGRLGLVAVLVFVPFLCNLNPIRQRQTTIDLVAKRLNQEAKANDLILVYPWYCSVTFHRYYHGAAPWITLPILPDSGVARYDLLREKLAETAPMQPIFAQILQAVAGGGKLWIVGDLPHPLEDETAPPDLPPAPNGPQGWFDVPYSYVWGRQAEYLLTIHRLRVEPVAIDFGVGANIYENASLSVVRGIGATP